MKNKNQITITSVTLTALLLMSLAALQADEVAVSSLDLSLAANNSGWAPRANLSTSGKPITLNGTVFANGLGSHTKFRLVIDCHGTAKRFTAKVGVNDAANKQYASVVFRVEGDGKKLFMSPVMRPGDAPVLVDVDLSGIQHLVLLAWNGEGGGQADDHADWADASIRYEDAAPLALASAEPRKLLTPPAPPTPRINGPRVIGARPGNPFLFCVPVTGERPMKVTTMGLPKGLGLDPATGIITGTTPAAGTYEVTLTATNARGRATRELSIVAGNILALTPPMGWNSWNCFASKVTREDILRQANAMATSGLRDHGYAYINIDDFWMPKNEDTDPTLHGPERDANGRINSNARFPDMPGLTASIHKLGLKAGIYSSPGPKTCGGCISSWQHEKQDAERFAEWGFDYLKYDWCSYNQVVSGNYEDKAYAKKPYMVMGEHLRKQKRDIVFSMCQYGMAKVWEWGSEVGGNTWRTTNDIGDSWNSMSTIGFSQAGHEPFVKPGCWNDPDMMIAGWVWGRFTNLSDDEQYTHVTLWSLQAAPLLLGCDLTHVDEFTMNLLGNDEVIEVNQDPLGRMAGRIATRGDTQVWAKPMSDGSMAVGLFNLGDETVPVSITWNELKLTGTQQVRDLWRQKNIGTQADGFSVDIPRHGVMLIRLFPEKQ